MERASGGNRGRVREAVALTYALITAARNEEARLGDAMRAVAAQTRLPVRWMVVSDGSTDRTDEMVQHYSERYPWIQLLRRDRAGDRSFAGKADAVNAGYESLRALEFDLVGNLDADIVVPTDYYEFLVGRFEELPELGVAGTPFVEDPGKPWAHSYGHALADVNHVSGACQMFRRRCFEEIGGFVPLAGGGVDWAAVTTARMRGWTTRTFLERSCVHGRAMGTADRGRIRARFRHGQEDYSVGSHPLWEIARGVFQMRNKPYVFGGMALLLGYAWAWARHRPSPIPRELREFHGREQMHRLRRLCGRVGTGR